MCEACARKSHAKGRKSKHTWTDVLFMEKDELGPDDEFCSECEQRKAARVCDQCGDNYCDGCYRRTHHRGRRLQVGLRNHITPFYVCMYALYGDIYRFIHPLYTLNAPSYTAIHLYTPLYTFIHLMYTTCTPYIHLTHLYTPLMQSFEPDFMNQNYNCVPAYDKYSLYIQCSEIFTLRNEKLHTET